MWKYERYFSIILILCNTEYEIEMVPVSLHIEDQSQKVQQKPNFNT